MVHVFYVETKTSINKAVTHSSSRFSAKYLVSSVLLSRDLVLRYLVFTDVLLLSAKYVTFKILIAFTVNTVFWGASLWNLRYLHRTLLVPSYVWQF